MKRTVKMRWMKAYFVMAEIADITFGAWGNWVLKWMRLSQSGMQIGFAWNVRWLIPMLLKMRPFVNIAVTYKDDVFI